MKTIVVVVNGTRARFFTLQPAELPVYESGPRLVEQECLVNPEQEATGTDLWSDNSGGNRNSSGGVGHGLDDHRDRHVAEYERRFTQSVATEALKLARDQKASQVVLAAKNRVLSLLREKLSSSNGFELKEVAKDYSKLTVLELQEQLASLNLVPALRGLTGQ